MDEFAENTLNIAFASNDLRHLNEHFGSCPQFTIYRVSAQGSEHLRTVDFMASEGHNQKKIDARLTALQDCFAVYCLACGNPVRQQLMANGIRVVIHPQADLIANLVTQIQDNWPGEIALRQQRQNSKKQDSDYFEKLADSEWDVEN